MALQRKSGELPPGSVSLSEGDAVTYQWNIIWSWTPRSDVWPFSSGLGILGCLTAATGIYINNHYRNKLKLFNHGKLSSYMPIVVIPTIMSTLFHQQLVTNDILIQKSCPVCVELRAAAIQAFFGCVYPTVLSPLGNFMFATRHGTYNIPYITSDYKQVLRLWQKFTKPVGNILLAICAFQAIAAMGIAHCEAKSYFRVQSKLAKLEQYYDEKESVQQLI